MNPKSTRPKGRKVPAPWWNNKCTEAINIRNALYRTYKTHPSLDNLKL